MSKLELVFNELSSVVDRKISSGSDVGLRQIGGGSGDGGFLGTIFSWGKALAGWAWAAISSAFSFTWTAVWTRFVQTVSFIYNFNWNATDQQLDQLIQNQINILSGMLGGTVGNLLGWVVCGIVPAAGMVYFNEALGLKLLRDVGEEALDEFLGNMQVLCQQAGIGLAQMWMITLYKAERRLIKAAAQKPAIKNILGPKITKIIEAWGENGTKPWSFRKAVEDKIESIESDWLQNFVEEGYEEFLDACVEAGYVVAAGVDDWALKQGIQQNIILGQQRIVELTPDREIPDERVIIAGPEQTVKNTLTNVMAQYQLIENRDVGQIIGQPLIESVNTATPELALKVILYSVKTPPFNKATTIAQYSIPDVERAKIDWEKIKYACGGANGYQYGRFCARAKLDNGRQMAIYAGSDSEAEQRLKAFVELSDAEILSLTVSEEKKTGLRANGQPLEKETIQVYPAYVTVVNSQKLLNTTKGKPSLHGNYARKSARLPLFTDKKPDEWDRVIADLLTTTGIG